MINYIALFTALALSGVSAYYSIVGMTAIFPGAVIPIVVMAGTLELAKVVAASWLYRQWKTTGWFLRTYLIGAILVLVSLSSMGIFGFLSKSHIESRIALETADAGRMVELETTSETLNIQIADLKKRISFIDDSIQKMIDSGKSTSALRILDDQKKERSLIVSKKEELELRLAENSQKKIKLKLETTKLEADVGPIKYVAEIIYGSSDGVVLDKAVRLVIVIIVGIFDPTAIILLIAANSGLMKSKKNTETIDDRIMLDPSDVFTMSKTNEHRQETENSRNDTRPDLPNRDTSTQPSRSGPSWMDRYVSRKTA